MPLMLGLWSQALQQMKLAGPRSSAFEKLQQTVEQHRDEVFPPQYFGQKVQMLEEQIAQAWRTPNCWHCGMEPPQEAGGGTRQKKATPVGLSRHVRPRALQALESAVVTQRMSKIGMHGLRGLKHFHLMWLGRGFENECGVDALTHQQRRGHPPTPQVDKCRAAS